MKLNKSPYVILILGLLGSFVLFSLWSARQAANNGSRIADPAYYSKGLKYTNTQLERQTAASRGWSLESEIDGHQMRFKLHDSQRQPLREAAGELTLYLTREKQMLLLQADEESPGEYRIILPQHLRGSLSARIEFFLQGARIGRQLLINL